MCHLWARQSEAEGQSPLFLLPLRNSEGSENFKFKLSLPQCCQNRKEHFVWLLELSLLILTYVDLYF